jgi:hypothetical protein
MQRIRMSLPYFKENGWEAEVITVDEQYYDVQKDPYLLKSLPTHIQIRKVKALSKKWTSKLGLGSLALRSMWFYMKEVNQLLKKQHFDLIYFSTTEFPICILGTYWKKKFNIPYVIDMQDPWHSDYYQNKPKTERPKKYWISYRLHQFLEPIAMKNVDGLIAVSQAYIDTLQNRYARLKKVPSKVITFGAFEPDFDFVKSNEKLFSSSNQKIIGSFNFVYVGRGGHDMKPALLLLFKALQKGLAEIPAIFSKIKLHFIGTSYAPKGEGISTIEPLAYKMGLTNHVNEQTNRISFYQSIYTLLKADVLLIIGSDDPQYTASKIYPYILAERPLLAFFHPESSAAQIIEDCNAGKVVSLIEDSEIAIHEIYINLLKMVQQPKIQKTNWLAFERYTAENMTQQQCHLFNQIIH